MLGSNSGTEAQIGVADKRGLPPCGARQRPKVGSQRTRRWSKGGSNRWSPVHKKTSFETTLITSVSSPPGNHAGPRERDRRFESASLQRSVIDEPVPPRLARHHRRWRRAPLT